MAAGLRAKMVACVEAVRRVEAEAGAMVQVTAAAALVACRQKLVLYQGTSN